MLRLLKSDMYLYFTSFTPVAYKLGFPRTQSPRKGHLFTRSSSEGERLLRATLQRKICRQRLKNYLIHKARKNAFHIKLGSRGGHMLEDVGYKLILAINHTFPAIEFHILSTIRRITLNQGESKRLSRSNSLLVHQSICSDGDTDTSRTDWRLTTNVSTCFPVTDQINVTEYHSYFDRDPESLGGNI